jgi:hypothetical protein
MRSVPSNHMQMTLMQMDNKRKGIEAFEKGYSIIIILKEKFLLAKRKRSLMKNSIWKVRRGNSQILRLTMLQLMNFTKNFKFRKDKIQMKW